MSGVWWWLRGASGERGSCESVSSVGSACTAASFAFVAPRWPPAHPGGHHAAPRPAPGQPLHVKYGLPQDAATLPVRRPLSGPARRAASECGPRRAPHVPGKRRAPPPPALHVRRRASKRPAPRPPAVYRRSAPPALMEAPPAEPSPTAATSLSNRDFKLRPERSFLRQIFENRWRNSSAEHVPPRILPSISELDREATRILQTVRTQGPDLDSNDSFGTRRRDSNSSWICTRCLRKYGALTPICVYCLPNSKLPGGSGFGDRSSRSLEHSTQTTLSNLNSSNYMEMDEKEKLKEMLKEIKDSLPKRPKHNTKEVPSDINIHNDGAQASTSAAILQPPVASLETPTLPMGYSVLKDLKDFKESSPISTNSSSLAALSKHGLLNPTNEITGQGKITKSEAVLVTHQVIIMDPQARKEIENKSVNCVKIIKTAVNDEKKLKKPDTKNILEQAISSRTDTNNETKNQPLRISSLLNPVYIPKSSNQNLPTISTPIFRTENTSAAPSSTPKSNSLIVNNHGKDSVESSTQDKVSKDTNISTSQSDKTNLQKLTVKSKDSSKTQSSEAPSSSKNNNLQSNQKSNSFNVQLLSQHSRKRELINQLEQSIAMGDERAAAEAATKLAQLRLSCSVLSFSSQIMAETSTSKSAERNLNPQKVTDTKNKTVEQQKIQTNASVTPLVSKVTETKNPKTTVLPTISESILSTERQDKATEETKQVKPGSPLPGPSTSHKASGKNEDHKTTIQVWIEDKEDTRGPIRLTISRNETLRELKQQAEESLGLNAGLQRWIVGKTLCNEDSTPLISLAGPQLSVPFYLCLVETESKKSASTETAAKPSEVYSELIALEEQALIPNAEAFECSVCLEAVAAGEGAALRECAHAWCRACLAAAAESCAAATPACPAPGCAGVLQERELRALLSPERFERWLARGLRRAAAAQRHAVHCRTPDCAGWALCEPPVTTFPCPLCKEHNCVPCQAIHTGESCSQYRKRLEGASAAVAAADDGSRALLEAMVARGEALACPQCGALLSKKWGCDWLKCPACATEICWVTRGRRWGPAGRGDTSAGCRCGVDGRRCHPTCTYCH